MNDLNRKDSLMEKWAAVTTKDKVLLVLMIAIIIGVGVYFLFTFMNKSMEQKMRETEEYRQALTYIAENQTTYAKNREEKAAMREKLINADSKIVGKLSTMASKLGFDVTVTPKEAHSTSDDSGAEEQEIEVSFKNVEYDKFLEYIIQIHKLDTPIYMRHLSITRTSNNTTSDTKMSVSITLMSYRLKEQNAT